LGHSRADATQSTYRARHVAGHERAVDLEDRHRQLAEVRERGVAGAEVVERELHAERVERVEILEAVRRLHHQRVAP